MNYFDTKKLCDCNKAYPMVLKHEGKGLILHKVNYTFEGFETYCGHQFTDYLAKLPETVEEAGEFNKICPHCFPTGIEFEN